MAIHNTIKDFRQGVVTQGGFQFTSLYRLSIDCIGARAISTIYPTALVLPGRSFSFFEHDIWGPVRRVPYKRVYTQFNATFIIFQDWKEKNEFEAWMDAIIPPSYGGVVGSNAGGSSPSTGFGGVGQFFDDIGNFVSNVNSTEAGDSSFSGSYGDTINYDQAGTITIEFLNAEDKTKVNSTMTLLEAFPATISQVAMGADSTGYPTYTVGFQFREYLVS